jgi:hypothetical protein
MKSLVIAAMFASAVAGPIIVHGNGTGVADPADSVRAQCALYLHFEYDRERCFDILQGRHAAMGATSGN